MGKFFGRSHHRRSPLKKFSKLSFIFLVFVLLVLIVCLVVYEFQEEVVGFLVVIGKIVLILVVAYLLYLVLFNRR